MTSKKNNLSRKKNKNIVHRNVMKDLTIDLIITLDKKKPHKWD